jgi:hypothetical protein
MEVLREGTIISLFCLESSGFGKTPSGFGLKQPVLFLHIYPVEKFVNFLIQRRLTSPIEE